jgi:2-oxoglutarate dehydrogenase complex dehydrogenase (E1) component-like enzyme
MSCLLMFLTFAAFANFSSYSQTRDTLEKYCSTDRPQHYELMANRVSRAREVTPDTVKGDVAVIKKAQASLDQCYTKKASFDVCDVDRVTELTWMEIRQENARASFTQDQFVQKAEEWGD